LAAGSPVNISIKHLWLIVFCLWWIATQQAIAGPLAIRVVNLGLTNMQAQIAESDYNTCDAPPRWGANMDNEIGGTNNIRPGATAYQTFTSGGDVNNTCWWWRYYPCNISGLNSIGPTNVGASFYPIQASPPSRPYLSGNYIFLAYPGGTAINDNSDGPGCKGGCASCGMVTWRVSEPYISLWLNDEPLGYRPAIGPQISLELSFKESDYSTGYYPAEFGVGKRWNCSWYSYVTTNANGSNLVYFPGGRQRTFYTTNDYLTNTRLTGDFTNGFTLAYPDGSQDVYHFIITNNVLIPQAFLTEQRNAQGQKTTLKYYPSPAGNPVVRLQYVIDGDGRTNFIYYATNNVFSTNLISQVVDPFGRVASLAYDTNGCLTNITDVATNFSAITYDTNNLPTSLTTPYGTTSFSIANTHGINNIPERGRSVLITQPDGGHQLYLYTNNAPGVSNAYPSSAVPSTSPFSNTFDNSDLKLRDTFYWGPRQYANLSSTNISSFLASDFRLARMQHWLTSASSSIGDTLSMVRDPSPDTNGLIEGQKIWYDYAGKTNTEFEGTQVEPLYVAQVLPDGTTRFTRSLRNSLGAVTNEISTYSAGSGVAFRTNIYVFDPNQIDLLITTNALGVQVSSNSYNANHEVTASYDALNEETFYTYNANQQLTSTAFPSGLVTTNIYGSDGLLAAQIDIGFDTNSFTYTNDLLLTHTDARGLTITNTWDNLNRLVSTAFLDGTFITNIYSALDFVQTVDRMGFTNSFGYDSMRRKISETNALGAVTTYSFCTCGSLNFILDAATNETQFFYDNQGNRTNTLFADGYSVTSALNLLKQVVSTTESGGNSLTNTYNNQGLLTTVSNAFGQVQSTAYDILDRATNTVDANGVSVATSFDNLNRPLNRSYPDGGVEHWGYTLNVSGSTSYTNQIGNVTLYGLDAMNRKTNEIVVGVTTNAFAYSGAGDLLELTDGKSQTTSWFYDQYGNVTNKFDANDTLIFVYQYDADNRLTSRWTPAKGSTVYRYNAAGDLTNVDYSGGTVTMPSVYLAYNLLDKLTNMNDAVGTTVFTWDAVGELTSEAGPWANDTVSYTYANRLRTGLSLNSQPSTFNISYGYDTARRLTSVSSPAGAFNYLYGAPSTASALVDAILLPNGALITNRFDSVARLLSTKLLNSSSSVLDFESYGYNQASQRTAETNTAGDFRNYTYDNEGELTAAIGKEAGGTTNRLQEQNGYAYDAAGNLNFRTNNALVQNFSVNNLNELSTVTRSGTLTVAGTTTVPATSVVVNGSAANHYADGTFALAGFTVTNGSNIFTAIGWDTVGNVSSNTVAVNLPATNNFAYDLNGNLTSDGLRGFDWDDENELIRVTATNSFKKEYVYDGKMRLRIRKEFSWNGGGWMETNEIHYVWDDKVVLQTRSSNNVPALTFTRGQDLSGTLQGAGGTGGLLAMTESTGASSYYKSDGNGNVMMLINSYQIAVAKYLYDPFGKPLADGGPKTFVNPVWSSSQIYDPDTGFFHYLYRIYVPDWDRFLNRDPIQERGGLNLYGFVGNQAVSAWDSLGLMLSASGGTPELHPLSYRHDSYLVFTITCPVTKKLVFHSVDFSDVYPLLEAAGFDPYSVPDLGGPTPGFPQTPNCGGRPVTMKVNIRSRFSEWTHNPPTPVPVGILPPVIIIIPPSGSTSDGVAAYVRGTVIYYDCEECCRSPRTGPQPVIPPIFPSFPP
jgi:RHS repeat-associated protein